MAVDGAATAAPQPQARSKAEDGRTRVSCLARNARTARRGRKSQPGRCGIEAGDPERSRGSASRRLIRQQQAAEVPWSPPSKECLWFRRILSAIPAHRYGRAHPTRDLEKPGSTSRDRWGGPRHGFIGSLAADKGLAAADPKSITVVATD
jgi:hypothetical protein